MNPVPLMRGVEIIPNLDTSTETLETTREFITNLGKEPVEALDYAGFVSSRVLDAMLKPSNVLWRGINQRKSIET